MAIFPETSSDGLMTYKSFHILLVYSQLILCSTPRYSKSHMFKKVIPKLIRWEHKIIAFGTTALYLKILIKPFLFKMLMLTTDFLWLFMQIEAIKERLAPQSCYLKNSFMGSQVKLWLSITILTSISKEYVQPFLNQISSIDAI